MRAHSSQLLDRYLPKWHFREVHCRRIEAPVEAVKEALRTLTQRATPASGIMMALRLAPEALAARRWPLAPVTPWFQLLLELGFVELGQSDEEIAFGAVGKFWRIRERLEAIADAETFGDFCKPGFAKGVVNFRVLEEPGSVKLTTETRVFATDGRAHRSFRPYWVPVRAIGGLMRREMLAAVARASEGRRLLQ